MPQTLPQTEEVSLLVRLLGYFHNEVDTLRICVWGNPQHIIFLSSSKVDEILRNHSHPTKKMQTDQFPCGIQLHHMSIDVDLLQIFKTVDPQQNLQLLLNIFLIIYLFFTPESIAGYPHHLVQSC